MNKETILEVLQSKKRFYHLKHFILFGSFAKDEANEKSDIDIAYIEDETHRLSFEKYIKLEKELEDTFQKKVDLLNYKKFNPLIKLHAKDSFIYV